MTWWGATQLVVSSKTEDMKETWPNTGDICSTPKGQIQNLPVGIPLEPRTNGSLQVKDSC